MPRFIPGLPYLLTSLQAANIPIALIADAHSGNLEFSIRHFHLTEWFSMNHMVCSNRTLKGKPSPQLYLKAAEKLGKSPSSCLIVESTAFGVQAAADAGAGEIDVYRQSGIFNEKDLFSADYLSYKPDDLRVNRDIFFLMKTVTGILKLYQPGMVVNLFGFS